MIHSVDYLLTENYRSVSNCSTNVGYESQDRITDDVTSTLWDDGSIKVCYVIMHRLTHDVTSTILSPAARLARLGAHGDQLILSFPIQVGA